MFWLSVPDPPRRSHNPTHDELLESRYQEALWAEYQLECESRERLDLHAVTLEEFEDMRDWSAGLLTPADVSGSESSYATATSL